VAHAATRESVFCMQMGARDRVTETLRAAFSRHGAGAATSAAIGIASEEVHQLLCPSANAASAKLQCSTTTDTHFPTKPGDVLPCCEEHTKSSDPSRVHF